jgi:ketosteroid isomerase-like protein
MTPAQPASAERIARAFAAAINQREAAAIAALTTEDHVLIDSLGARIEGRDAVRAAWEGYLRMVPDYAIQIDEALAIDAVVVLVGTAQGTFSRDGSLPAENRWTTPAAWRAVVRGSRVAEWRVYADNDPIRKIIARNA